MKAKYIKKSIIRCISVAVILALLSTCSMFSAFAADSSLEIKLTGKPGMYGAELSWEVTSGYTSAITGYNLYRGTSPDNLSATPISDFYLIDKQYLDQFALTGNMFYYTCRAIFKDGSLSGPSNVIGIDMVSGNVINVINDVSSGAAKLSLSGVKDGQTITVGEKVTLSAVSANLKFIQYYWKSMDDTSEWGQMGRQFVDQNNTSVVWDTAGRKPGNYIIKVQGLNIPDTEPIMEVVINITLKSVMVQSPLVKITLPDQPQTSNLVSGKIKVGASVSDSSIKAVDYYIDNYYITTGLREKKFIVYVNTSNYTNGIHGITANGRYLKSDKVSDMVYGTTKKINIQNKINNSTAISKVNQTITDSNVSNTNQNSSNTNTAVQYEIVPSKPGYLYPRAKTNQNVNYMFMKPNEYMKMDIKAKGSSKLFGISQNKDLKWVLGAKGIVKIDSNGTLTALKIGVCDLYLKSGNGKIYDSIRIVIPSKSNFFLMATNMPPKNKDGTDYFYYHALAIDKLSCKKTSDGQYKISMDVYNALGMTPVLSAYDGNWRAINGSNTYIEAFDYNPSGMKDIYNKTFIGVKDLATGGLFTNTARSGSVTKKTPVEKIVPAGGIVSISTSLMVSEDVLLYNMCDIVFKVWENTNDYKNLIKTNKFFKSHPKLKNIVNNAKFLNLLKHKLENDALKDFQKNLALKLIDSNPLYNSYVAYTEIMNFFENNEINLGDLAVQSFDIGTVTDATVDTAISALEDALLNKMPGGKLLKAEFAVFDSMDITVEIKQLIDARDALSLIILIPAD